MLINSSIILCLNLTLLLSMIGLDVMNCEVLYSGNRNDTSFFSGKIQYSVCVKVFILI